MTIRKYIDLLGNMGIRYIFFRLYHQFSIKIGFYKRKFPSNPPMREYFSVNAWRQEPGFSIGNMDFVKNENTRVDKIMNGYCLFFSKQWFFIGKNYDWVTNPMNNHTYDKYTHWTKIKDYSEEEGDIKFVWEPSRFSFVYDIIRNDYHSGQDNSEWIWEKIESWIDNNPINCGPNYRCSQEISIRVLNWTYCLNYYRKSHTLTDRLFNKIISAIYWQMKHVYDNINFSRIAVRNNHAITETLTLYVVGSLYPFFDHAFSWKKKGKKWFEQEIIYQVYPDGTYLQFSTNYHRVVVQLLNWAFMIGSFKNEFFNEIVYKRAYASLDFLYQSQNEVNGWLPNYGSNDGALFFPLTETDYRDFRPQLQTLHFFLTGKGLYENGLWNEEALFMNAQRNTCVDFPSIVRRLGWSTYPDGGFYILRQLDSVTFIRCGDHKDRPAQADNLHIDIWYGSSNVAYDGGSFKYNTDKGTIKYFSGSSSHNTVMLNDNDQMLKGPRFIWYFWTKRVNVSVHETIDSYQFSGTIKAFRVFNNKILHERRIIVCKEKFKWIVEDLLHNKPNDKLMRQLWHIKNPLTIAKSISIKDEPIIPKRESGYVSNYYGIKEEAIFWECTTTNNFIRTELVIA